MSFNHTHTITGFQGQKVHVAKLEMGSDGVARTKGQNPEEWHSWPGEGWTGPECYDTITVQETGNNANSPARLALREEGRLRGVEKSKKYNEHDQAAAMRKSRGWRGEDR